MAVIRNNNPTITASPYDSDAVYAENFFHHLKNIANDIKYSPSIQPIPKNIEPKDCIKVDLNNRFIDLENSIYKNFLAINTDHRSNTIYFEVDRFFEDIDLAKCSCIIQYINMGNPSKEYKLRFYPITLIDLESIPNKMILAWNIGGEATEYDGELIFSLLFYKVNSAGDRFSYCLNTQSASGNIATGMGYSPDQQKESYEYYKIEPQNYISLKNLIENKNVVWNDL